MSDSSIQHPDDTPVSRVDILKMRQGELREYVERIRSKRTSVFEKRDSIKRNISKARLDDTCTKIEGILTRTQKKLDKCDALLTDALDQLTKVRALELELEYLDKIEVPDVVEEKEDEVDGESTST